MTKTQVTLIALLLYRTRMLCSYIVQLVIIRTAQEEVDDFALHSVLLNQISI